MDGTLMDWQVPCLGLDGGQLLDDLASTLPGQPVSPDVLNSRKEQVQLRNLLDAAIEILAKQDVQLAAPCFTPEVRTPSAIPNPNPARVSREGRSSADRVRGAAV